MKFVVESIDIEVMCEQDALAPLHPHHVGVLVVLCRWSDLLGILEAARPTLVVSRLRAGLTQAELGASIGKPQSVIARWERGDVDPSLETLRRVIRGCGLDLHFHLSRLDDSNETIIDHHLKMTPAERFADLLARVDFHDRAQRERAVGNA
jgi:transcriptional regulator with XRE-family HTH domain